MVREIILAILIGYLLGSIPFAYVIGQGFYNKDIRKYGSRNLGGSNAGRVLGKKAGLSVMVLDLLKVFLATFIVSFFENTEAAMIFAGFFAAIGHCYPVFVNFKGGKAVAALYGFLLGMTVFGSYNILIFLLPLLMFFLVLYLWKIISLASMCSSVFVAAYVGITQESKLMFGALCAFAVLIIYRHRANVVRMIQGKENKIKWM